MLKNQSHYICDTLKCKPKLIFKGGKEDGWETIPLFF